jgi:hypothetical protein
MGWDELIRKLGEACDVTVPDGEIGIDALLSLADEVPRMSTASPTIPRQGCRGPLQVGQT